MRQQTKKDETAIYCSRSLKLLNEKNLFPFFLQSFVVVLYYNSVCLVWFPSKRVVLVVGL